MLPLIISEIKKKSVLDNMTVITKTVAQSKPLIKMLHVYQICSQNFKLSQTLQYSFYKRISNKEFLYRNACDVLNVFE